MQRTADPTRRIASEPTGDDLEQLAHALNAMLEALQRAREMERRFLADASHEMRTPLTALRGNAEYLARHGCADAAAFRDLESDMARLAQLLDRLLEVAREDAAGSPRSRSPSTRSSTASAPTHGCRCAASRGWPFAPMPTRSNARSRTWSRTPSCTGRADGPITLTRSARCQRGGAHGLGRRPRHPRCDGRPRHHALLARLQ